MDDFQRSRYQCLLFLLEETSEIASRETGQYKPAEIKKYLLLSPGVKKILPRDRYPAGSLWQIIDSGCEYPALSSGIRDGRVEFHEMIMDIWITESEDGPVYQFTFDGNRRALLFSQGKSDSLASNHDPSAIPRAVDEENVQIFECLLSNGANIKHRDSKQGTLLHFGAEKGCEVMVRALLKYGANIEAKREDGSTPLHLAVQNRFEQITGLLLECGASVDSKQNSSKTPLHVAAESSQAVLLQVLLKHGASIDAKTKEGSTPLHVAIKNGHVEIVSLLLQSGANVEAKCNNNKTPLYLAAESGQARIVELLLESGAGVNTSADDNTYQFFRKPPPLLIAIENRHPKIVEILLKNGADVDRTCHVAGLDCQLNALQLAVQSKCLETVDSVFKYRPSLSDEEARQTIRLAAFQNGKDCHKIMKMLFDAGFSLSPEDANDVELMQQAILNNYPEIVGSLLEYGMGVKELHLAKFMTRNCTFLHIAARYAQKDILHLLLENGADVDIKCSLGTKPIVDAVLFSNVVAVQLLLENGANIQDIPEIVCMAVKGGSAEIVESLLRNGANVSATTSSGRSPLHIASSGGLLDIVEVLLQFGAQVNAKDASDKTALHESSREGFYHIVEVLVQNGALIDAVDKSGETPVLVAIKQKHLQLAEVLLQLGASINLTHDKLGGVIPLETILRLNDSTFTQTVLDYDFLSGSSIAETDIVDLVWYFETTLRDIIPDGYDMIVNHLVKLKAAYSGISVENSATAWRRIEEKKKEFTSQCKAEVESLKKEQIGDSSVFFFDILTESENEIASYARNTSIQQVFSSDDLNRKFPIYSSVLSCQFQKGTLRKELEDKGFDSLKFLFGRSFPLPDELPVKIIKYLSNTDLRILICTGRG